METYEKILVLNNEYEADLMVEILTDRKIPHGVIRADDSALGSIIEMEFGWGYLKAPPAYREEITKIYQEIVRK